MVCIQVYFEIPYAPYTRKLTFFHKGSSETLSRNVYVQGNEEGENKFIITVKSFFFF